MMKSLTRNLGWKLASILAAFVLWLVFSGARELTASFTSPVQYRNVPKNLEISSTIVEQVHLVVRGPAPLLSRLDGTQLPVVLDLSAVRGPGLNTLTIDRRNVNLPSGVTLERSIPAQIQLRTEIRSSRAVPVHPRLEQIPGEMQVSAMVVTPDHLTIAGPQSHVSAIEQVETDPVDVRSLNSRGEAQTTAFSGDPQVVFTTSPTVTVRVTLAPKTTPISKK